MTIDRDAFDFEIWIFNWSQYCFKAYSANYCYNEIYYTAEDNNNIAYAEPKIYVFDGGGGNGAKWVYTPENLKFPSNNPNSGKMTWKVFKYSKVDHSFTIINEFTDYPKGKYTSS